MSRRIWGWLYIHGLDTWCSGGRAQPYTLPGDTLTRKDYKLIAKHLQLVKPVEDELFTSVWRQTVYSVANALEEDSGYFKRQMFLRACGALEEDDEDTQH